MKISQNFVQFAEEFCGYFAFFTLSLLLYLILFKSPKRLGAYKYLMIYLSIFELFYAFSMVWSPSKIYTKYSGFIISMDRSVTGVGYEIFNVLYCTMFGTSLANFGVHFIYRFLALRGNKEWTSSNPSKIVIWIASPLVLGAVYTVAIVHFWGPNESTEQFMRLKVLNNSPNSTLNDLSFIGFNIYPEDENGVQYANWKGIVGVTAVSSLITFSFNIMLYFGIKCYTELNKLTGISTVSKDYQSIQNQLFLALVMQTIIPLVFMHLPSTVIAALCFLNSVPEVLGQITAIFVSLYPVLDPLPNIFIIKSYRIALYRAICCRKGAELEPMSTNSFVNRNVSTVLES